MRQPILSFPKDSTIPDIHKAPQTVQVQLNIAVDHYDYQGTYQNLSDLLKKDVPFISHEYFFVSEGVCCWLNTFCVLAAEPGRAIWLWCPGLQRTGGGRLFKAGACLLAVGTDSPGCSGKKNHVWPEITIYGCISKSSWLGLRQKKKYYRCRT